MRNKKSYEGENSNQKSFKALKEMISDIREGFKNIDESLSGLFIDDVDEEKKDISEGIHDIEEVLEDIISIEDDSILKDSEDYRDIHEGLYYIKEGLHDVNEGLKAIYKGIYDVREGLNDILKNNIPERLKEKECVSDIDESAKDTVGP